MVIILISLVNSGVVPMFCEELFSGIEGKKGGETTFEVKFSMLEIYNEIARDLLDANGAKKKSGLKVRQHPKKGFYGKLIWIKHFDKRKRN